MAEEKRTVEAEVMEDGFAAASATSLVRQGQALMKAENDSLLAVAAQRPRNEAQFMKQALQELNLVPEMAKSMYYSIPYRERQADGTYKIVRVEGPSINAALSLARRWGNCTATARAINEDPDGFDLEGVFVDMESNFRVSKPWRVSKTFRRRDGRVELLNVQRLGLAIQAGFSKAMRNAILAGIPAIYVQAMYNRAKEIVGGKQDEPASEKVVVAVLKAFEKFGIGQEKLEQYAEATVKTWTGANVADLRGLYNALSDKQVTVAELFEPQPGEDTGTVTPGTLSAEALTKGEVKAQDDPPPQKAEPKPEPPKAEPPKKNGNGQKKEPPKPKPEPKPEPPKPEPPQGNEVDPEDKAIDDLFSR